MTKITAVESVDLRFPTSRWLDGSDAMNPAPDYSAAYVIIRTDAGDGLEGHGFTFTIGRGNELCTAAIDSYAPFVVGLDLEETLADLGGFWKRLTGESQLRWLGPEKGVVHLAVAAVVNAVWDLRAKREGKPLWRLLSEMSPREIVDLVDFRHIADVLSPERALELLESRVGGRAERTALIHREGVPAYTTSAGWLGYSDDKLRTLATEAVDAGWRHLKLKVGADIGDDVRRAGILREVLGPDRKLMMDANQVWNVDEAIRNMEALAPFDPWWIEEPTSPDDVLGHAEIARKIAPIRVATGEHVQNRVMFKQFLQAGGMGFCQIDACRLGGVNEVVAVLLLAAHHGIPVCPHAGGVGLCEYVQHLSIFDYIAVGASFDDVVVEYVDHLHEHFLDPVRMRNGRYVAPSAPGYSAQMHEATLRDHAWPGGAVWADAR
ncbi:enolase C-terminal domain-like protein [Streptosporangium sp. NPDC050855]|uniref:enolase C-terminal domain-like protein n=1 Tax=Streptosporangium sp. NPDC050855 TaxID=3366194 RepID=UPI0037A0F92A